MKTSKQLLFFILLPLLMCCESNKDARDREICALYEADKIDAVEALENLGLKPNTNGRRFEPIQTFCAQLNPYL